MSQIASLQHRYREEGGLPQIQCISPQTVEEELSPSVKEQVFLRGSFAGCLSEFWVNSMSWLVEIQPTTKNYLQSEGI